MACGSLANLWERHSRRARFASREGRAGRVDGSGSVRIHFTGWRFFNRLWWSHVCLGLDMNDTALKPLPDPSYVAPVIWDRYLDCLNVWWNHPADVTPC